MKAEAGFHEGVVVAIGGPAHALAELGSAENGAISLAGVLAAAVAVIDQAGGRLPIADRVRQCVQHERLGHLFGEAPADDATGTEVEHQGQIGKGSFFERDVCDVSDPHAVELDRRRRPLQEVGTVAQGMAAVGGLGPEGLRLNRLQTLRFQQFSHTIDAAGPALGLQFDGDPARAVAPLMMPEDVSNERHEFPVPLFPCRFRMERPGVVAGPADFQGVADRDQRKGALEGELFDEGIGFAQACRLKMANAFFRMSRSRSTRRSSSSSWATRSPKVRPAGPARCRIACFQLYRTFGSERPSRSATDGAEWPSRSNWTASCLNSSVYERRVRTLRCGFAGAIGSSFLFLAE